MPKITVDLTFTEHDDTFFLLNPIAEGEAKDGTEVMAAFDASGQMLIIEYGGRQFATQTTSLLGQLFTKLGEYARSTQLDI